MSFLDMGAYAFSNWKTNILKADDHTKHSNAAQLIATAMEVLESIDDEMLFPTSEYETLADVRTDLINWSHGEYDG